MDLGQLGMQMIKIRYFPYVFLLGELRPTVVLALKLAVNQPVKCHVLGEMEQPRLCQVEGARFALTWECLERLPKTSAVTQRRGSTSSSHPVG